MSRNLTPRESVQQLMDACNRRDIGAALATFAADAVYHNIPLQPVTGTEAIREVLEPFLTMATKVDWVVHNWAEGTTGLVMNERTDRFLINGEWLELPVTGVFEVQDGRIVAWRDYFDMQPLASVLQPPG